jgi:hypothetical protein
MASIYFDESRNLIGCWRGRNFKKLLKASRRRKINRKYGKGLIKLHQIRRWNVVQTQIFIWTTWIWGMMILANTISLTLSLSHYPLSNNHRKVPWFVVIRRSSQNQIKRLQNFSFTVSPSPGYNTTWSLSGFKQQYLWKIALKWLAWH